MSSMNRPILPVALLSGLFVFLLQSSVQAVTIGGTPSEGDEDASGLTAMFAGDRFENFRNMDRFVPISTMPASPNPWRLGENLNSLE